VAEAWLPKGGGASQRCFGVFYLVVVNYLIRCWNLINIFLSFTFSLFTNCVCLCVCVCSLSVSFTLAIAVSFWLRQAFHAGRESDPKAYPRSDYPPTHRQRRPSSMQLLTTKLGAVPNPRIPESQNPSTPQCQNGSQKRQSTNWALQVIHGHSRIDTWRWEREWGGSESSLGDSLWFRCGVVWAWDEKWRKRICYQAGSQHNAKKKRSCNSTMTQGISTDRYLVGTWNYTLKK